MSRKSQSQIGILVLTAALGVGVGGGGYHLLAGGKKAPVAKKCSPKILKPRTRAERLVSNRHREAAFERFRRTASHEALAQGQTPSSKGSATQSPNCECPEPSVFAKLQQSLFGSDDPAAEKELLAQLDKVESDVGDAEAMDISDEEYRAEHKKYIDEVKQELANQASLTSKEKTQLDSILGKLRETLETQDKALFATMAQEENQEGMEIPAKEVYRQQLLTAQAMMKAQEQFENMLGKERMKKLGPGLGDVTGFLDYLPEVGPAGMGGEANANAQEVEAG